jgi:tetratricopeptide (TPR) repeat protein
MQKRNEFKCEAPVAEAAEAVPARLEAAVAAELARLAEAALPPGPTLIDLLHRQGAARIAAGAPDEAAACWADAAALPAEGVPPRQAAALLLDLGRLRLGMGAPDRAAAPLDAAIAVLRAGEPNGRDLPLALAARAAAAAGRRAAIALLTEAAALLEARVQRRGSAQDAAQLAHVLLDLGRAQDAQGDRVAARDAYAGGVEVTAALVQAAPSHQSRNIRNAALNHLGRSEAALGRPEVAIGLFRDSAADMRRLVHHEGRRDLADDLARAEADLAALQAVMAAA